MCGLPGIPPLPFFLPSRKHAGTLPAHRRRDSRPRQLGCARRLSRHRVRHRRERRAQTQVLRLLDAALSQRKAAHGARAQLHDQRHDDAAPAHARFQRAHADGLGCLRHACRKRRHQIRSSTREVDIRQHRLHAATDEGDGARHRLVARNVRLRSGLLQMESVAVSAHARAGHRVPQDAGRQLGSGGQHRARQRAGHRWARLALRRTGRKTGNPRLLPSHHRLRGRVA